MKFYTITNDDGDKACAFTLAEAKRIASTWSRDPHIMMLDIDVTADNMRRILGDLGGYCKDIKHY